MFSAHAHRSGWRRNDDVERKKAVSSHRTPEKGESQK
jgi:hypothetical protein